MTHAFKLHGYFAGALFSAQELYGNVVLAAEINAVSRGIIQMDLPQDLSAQETGDGKGTRATDYLGMLQADFVFANMNGPELDSGTVAEYMVASMLGMPRVQFRSDFRNVGDVPTSFSDQITVGQTNVVPYNLMLGHDNSALVFANSISLYKASGNPQEFLRKLAIAAIQGIQLAFKHAEIITSEDYSFHEKALVRNLKLDAAAVGDLLKKKQQRQLSDEYRQRIEMLLSVNPAMDSPSSS